MQARESKTGAARETGWGEQKGKKALARGQAARTSEGRPQWRNIER